MSDISYGLKLKKYLDNGSAKVLSINKDTGIIDLSNNQVLGNVHLDMRENPPILHGEKII